MEFPLVLEAPYSALNLYMKPNATVVFNGSYESRYSRL